MRPVKVKLAHLTILFHTRHPCSFMADKVLFFYEDDNVKSDVS